MPTLSASLYFERPSIERKKGLDLSSLSEGREEDRETTHPRNNGRRFIHLRPDAPSQHFNTFLSIVISSKVNTRRLGTSIDL